MRHTLRLMIIIVCCAAAAVFALVAGRCGRRHSWPGSLWLAPAILLAVAGFAATHL